MTINNPYAFDDDADDDLLGDKGKSRKHALDGTPCPHCGIPHDVRAPADIPEEVLDKLAEMLDGMPPDIIKSTIIVTRSSPHRAKMVKDFIGFSHMLEGLAKQGPLMLAMAEILDEMSGGKLERKWGVYQSERELVINHTILKSVNTILDGFETRVREADTPDPEDTTLIELLTTLRDATIEKLTAAVGRYRARATESGHEIDEHLIDVGTFDEDRMRSKFTDASIMDPVKDALDTTRDPHK